MQQMRIRTATILVAIVAVDFALLREMPAPFLLVPFIAVTFVSFNLVLVQVLALRRPLGAFHLGFLGVGLLYVILSLNLRTAMLQALIDRYRSWTGDSTTWRFNSGNQIMFAEQGLILGLGLLACLAGGALVKYGKHLVWSRAPN